MCWSVDRDASRGRIFDSLIPFEKCESCLIYLIIYLLPLIGVLVQMKTRLICTSYRTVQSAPIYFASTNRTIESPIISKFVTFIVNYIFVFLGYS